MTLTLDVKNLSVHTRRGSATRTLLRPTSFSLPAARLTALIGESGSGKSTLACALTRLVPRPDLFDVAGSAQFGVLDLLAVDATMLRDIRRHHIRYVMQEPTESMNPLLRVGSQLLESFPDPASGNDARDLLERVGLADPKSVLRAFPHQLSVGMLQRVAIAMAIAPGPRLLIADEPTSALDLPTRVQIMDLLGSLQRELHCAALVVTHDPAIIDRSADQVIVLFAGRIVEINRHKPFTSSARHPYSRQLTGRDPAVRTPAGATFGGGCAFASRCPRVQERCTREEPELTPVAHEGLVRCFYWK